MEVTAASDGDVIVDDPCGLTFPMCFASQPYCAGYLHPEQLGWRTRRQRCQSQEPLCQSDVTMLQCYTQAIWPPIQHHLCPNTHAPVGQSAGKLQSVLQ